MANANQLDLLTPFMQQYGNNYLASSKQQAELQRRRLHLQRKHLQLQRRRLRIKQTQTLVYSVVGIGIAGSVCIVAYVGNKILRTVVGKLHNLRFDFDWRKPGFVVKVPGEKDEPRRPV